ncbi:MAG: class I SAM-dependent methyltransferase [bacterium]|nr:class I SAM-dependent methyltransferase [bacterium]
MVQDFDYPGLILDIGGGGEGVIGRLKGDRVIAVDINKRELEDAPDGPLKVVMDARDLKFVDGSFHAATSFFTLMYIRGSDHPLVFTEVFRVLKPGGTFLVWEVVLPRRLDESKDIVVIPLTIKLPGEEIGTGYGTRWPEKRQDLSYYRQVAEAAGFQVVAAKEEGQQLFLELRRP